MGIISIVDTCLRLIGFLLKVIELMPTMSHNHKAHSLPNLHCEHTLAPSHISISKAGPSQTLSRLI